MLLAIPMMILSIIGVVLCAYLVQNLTVLQSPKLMVISFVMLTIFFCFALLWATKAGTAFAHQLYGTTLPPNEPPGLNMVLSEDIRCVYMLRRATALPSS